MTTSLFAALGVATAKSSVMSSTAPASEAVEFPQQIDAQLPSTGDHRGQLRSFNANRQMKSNWTDWDRAFQGLPPVGYVLRVESTTHHWLRFHSLPDPERYPTTAADMAEVLQRDNTLASAVFGDGTEILAWIAHYGPSAPPVDTALWHWAEPHLRWRCDEAEFETLAQARFLERALVWRPGALDDEFRLQALDKLGSTTLFAPESGRAFCPYDGGLDLFLPSANDIDTLRRSFPDWVSRHPEGL